MFPHTITIYNKYVEASIEKWQRTVIPGVFWRSSKGAVLRKMGVVTPDGLQATTQVIIPMSVEDAMALLAAKKGTEARKYAKPKVWEALADKTGFWTLQAGDTIALGEITQEILASSKELRGLDDVILVTAVDTKNFGAGMSNWEVTGK